MIDNSLRHIGIVLVAASIIGRAGGGEPYWKLFVVGIAATSRGAGYYPSEVLKKLTVAVEKKQKELCWKEVDVLSKAHVKPDEAMAITTKAGSIIGEAGGGEGLNWKRIVDGVAATSKSVGYDPAKVLGKLIVVIEKKLRSL